MPASTWPRPLVLMCALLRTDGAAEAGKLAAALSGEEWETFADLAIARHRLAPLVGPALEALEVPDGVRERFAAAVRDNELATMVQIAETRRIRTALAAIGVDLTVFKGWPLAERLYGSASARHAGDLDLLVPEDRVLESCAALETIGFQPSADTAKFRRRVRGLGNPQLIRACKDIEMVRPVTGVTVELHWRLLNYHGWPEFLDRPGALVRQETDAGPIRTPDDQVNLMYLSTHGALHLWDQLRWLVDIAALARARGAARLGEDIALARETGVLRPVVFALGLAGRLFGSPVPEGPARAEPGIPGLERWILRRLGHPYGALARARYQAGIRWMGLRLARDWRQALGVAGYDTTRRLRLLSLDLASGSRGRGRARSGKS